MKKSRTYFVIALFAIALSANPAYSKIIMKPYLQASANGSIFVMAECDSKDPVTVEYGTSLMYGSKSASSFYQEAETRRKPTYVHRIKLENLNPASIYYYKVYQTKDESYTSEFKSPVMPGSPFRFAVMGDCRSNPTIHSNIDKRIKCYNPYFSLYGGDLCYNGDYSTWKSDFFIDAELDLSASVPFFNAVGNHEGWTKNTKAFTQAPDSKSGQQDYYSFDYGDVHFLILNSEASCSKGTAQYAFAYNDLKNTDKKWKVVSFHVPAYCFGGHGINKSLQTASKEIFEPLKVDVVVAGHSHFYQHNLVNGIHHFVIGGGGAPIYNTGSSPNTIKSAMEFHYAIFDASPDSLSMTVYNLKGDVLDSLKLKK